MPFIISRCLLFVNPFFLPSRFEIRGLLLENRTPVRFPRGQLLYNTTACNRLSTAFSRVFKKTFQLVPRVFFDRSKPGLSPQFIPDVESGRRVSTRPCLAHLIGRQMQTGGADRCDTGKVCPRLAKHMHPHFPFAKNVGTKGGGLHPLFTKEWEQIHCRMGAIRI